MISFFPIGSYKILTHYDLKNIEFNGTQFQLPNNTKIYGLALVRILCPQNLLMPFLSYRSSVTGKTSLPCCKCCADKENLECDHTKE